MDLLRWTCWTSRFILPEEDTMGVVREGRAAPATGYDFGNKRQYRRTVWRQFREFIGPHRAAAHCLLMPSSEGYTDPDGGEIGVALRNGFREEHLHIVDRNPAICAHIKRRWPRVTTYGVELHQAIHRIGQTFGHSALTCINLDLTSCLSDDVMSLCRFAALLMGPRAVLAITVLKGREKLERMRPDDRAPTRESMLSAIQWTRGRFAWLVIEAMLQERTRVVELAGIGWPAYWPRMASVHKLHSGEYQSGNQRMVYSIAGLHSLDSGCP